MHENWLPIRGYEGLYEVSDQGAVRSLPRYVRGVSKAGLVHRRLRAGKTLAPVRHTRGYLTVVLAGRRSNRSFLIHRLVAAAFLKRPRGSREVNHKDLNKDNNAASNLEWCTRAHNQQHASAHGHCSRLRGEQRASSKLTDDKVRQILLLIKQGLSNVEIAPMFGVSTAPISYIRTGKAWTHISREEIAPPR